MYIGGIGRAAGWPCPLRFRARLPHADAEGPHLQVQASEVGPLIGRAYSAAAAISARISAQRRQHIVRCPSPSITRRVLPGMALAYQCEFTGFTQRSVPPCQMKVLWGVEGGSVRGNLHCCLWQGCLLHTKCAADGSPRKPI